MQSATLLINHNADVNAKSTFGETPLSKAISHNGEEIIKLLLDKGADIEQTIHDESLLHLAASKGFVNIVELLLHHLGIEVTSENNQGWTALHRAVENCNLKATELLLNRGADVNCATNSGLTPLHLAAAKGSFDIVQLLVDRGANIDSRTKVDGRTALQFAALKGCIRAVKYLIINGAKVNSDKPERLSPLFLAAGRGHIDVF